VGGAHARVDAAAGVSRALVVTLEVGQMLLRSPAFAEARSSSWARPYCKFPWLTSLETPVAVLQLTGALVDQDGKAIRIGAEAFQAKRTPFVA
jgi:hypothetical protein